MEHQHDQFFLRHSGNYLSTVRTCCCVYTLVDIFFLSFYNGSRVYKGVADNITRDLPKITKNTQIMG